MKKMIALRRHAYGVGSKETGERYEASAHEARTLVALGWAKYDEGDEVAPTSGAVSQDASAEGDASVDAASAETPSAAKPPKPAKSGKAGKSGYERRDMQAKD